MTVQRHEQLADQAYGFRHVIRRALLLGLPFVALAPFLAPGAGADGADPLGRWLLLVFQRHSPEQTEGLSNNTSEDIRRPADGPPKSSR